MNVPLTATSGTVFLYQDGLNIDKIKLKNDYHKLYHSKRPVDPAIFDKFFFVNETDSEENLKEKTLVDNLIRIHDLRTVNFVMLTHDDKPLSTENKTKFRDMMIKWDAHFKSNSYNGFLTLRICTQNFQAKLFENHQVRNVERFSLGWNETRYC